MEEIMLAIDAILKVIIGPTPAFVDELIERARKGEVKFLISEFALYCALYSVQEGDQVNARHLAEVLKYAQILPDAPAYLGPEERESWKPSQEEINHWREVALEKA